MKKGLLLWDIDGTLVQRTASKAKSIHLRALGKENTFTSTELTGLTDWDVLKNYEEDILVVSKAFAKLDSLQEEEAPTEFSLIHGVDERLFQDLSRFWDHGILTGNSLSRALFKLKAVKIENYFLTENIFACTPEDTREKIALRMVSKVKKIYSSIVVIGDTENDIKSSQKVNLPVVAVATGKFSFSQLYALQPTLTIQDLDSDRQKFYNFLSSRAM